MCIFSLVYRVVPDCPIFVLTNRDESTDRPTVLPLVSSNDDGTRWFGGVDAKAGGTWLGINEHGLLAAITNRKKVPLPPDPRSRGLLCRDALSQPTAEAARDLVLRDLARRAYAGFNLILVTADSAWVIEAADTVSATELGPGIHSVSNGPVAGDDPRIKLAQSLVSRMLDETHDLKALFEKAQQICAVHSDSGPAMCLHGDKWGTIGSTVIALSRQPRDWQYHYSPGPPCRTPYIDYSHALKTLHAGR